MLVQEMTDVSLPARLRRHWRLIVSVTAAVIFIGAFLQWGPVGLGNGPLDLGILSVTQGGTVLHGEQRIAVIMPVQNSALAAAVVDSVQFEGAQGFALPRPISLWAITFTHCAGGWSLAARPGPPVLGDGCGGRGLGPLIGHGFGYEERPGDMALAEVAVPRPAECWVITAVVVHYHVGIRHYAATDPLGYSFCGARSSTALQQAATKAAIG
jgi:hypothetical protein